MSSYRVVRVNGLGITGHEVQGMIVADPNRGFVCAEEAPFDVAVRWASVHSLNNPALFQVEDVTHGQVVAQFRDGAQTYPRTRFSAP